MKNFTKLFLITSILLLIFSLNGLVFASITKTNQDRLNNVLNKLTTCDKSTKMQTLLSGLKTKYSGSSSIQEMIEYLNSKINSKRTSLKCITDNTTTDIVDDTTNTGTTNICNEKAKEGMSCTSGGHVASTGGWCSKEGKIYYNIEESNSKGLDCYESKYNDKCNNKINTARTCTGSGYVSTENVWCLGNTYLGTIKNANALGVSCSLKKNTTSTGNVNEKQKCDKSYESIYQNIKFKNYFKASKLSEINDVYPKSGRYQTQTLSRFKAFFPKGGKGITFMIYLCGWPLQRCDEGVTIKYWIGPIEPSKKGTGDNDIWAGKYLEKIAGNEDTAMLINSKDLQPSEEAKWIYFKLTYPPSERDSNKKEYTGCQTQGMQIVNSSYELDLVKYSDWYNNEAKWEENGDPEYDCTNY